MKKILGLLLALAVLSSGFGALGAADISLSINGDAANSKIAPFIQGETLYVPVRAFCEAIGAQCEWDNDARAVIVKIGASKIEIPIGEALIKRDGLKTTFNAKNIIKDGFSYIALESLDALGAKGEFIKEERRVDIAASTLDGRYFYIVHKESGKVLMPEGGAVNDGPAIVAATPDESAAQLWLFSSRGANTYTLTNQHSKRCVDMPNWRSDVGLGLIQYGNTEGTNQWITPVKSDDGTYFLQIFHSKLYLSISEDGHVTQEELSGNAAQKFVFEEKINDASSVSQEEALPDTAPDALGGKFFSITIADKALAITQGADVWRFVAQGEGVYSLINKETSLALCFKGGALTEEVPDFSSAQRFAFIENENGYAVKCEGNSVYLTYENDVFTFLPQTGAKNQLAALNAAVIDRAKYSEGSMSGRYFTLSFNGGTTLCIENNSDENGAKVVAAAGAEDDGDVWAFVAQGGGMYTLVNKKSNRAVDIPGGSREAGAGAIAYTPNYDSNQTFLLEENADGTYNLKNENSALYLALKDGYITQEEDATPFTLTDKGESGAKMIGAAATLFLLKGEEALTNAKVQWNEVGGATSYDVFRSVNGEAFGFLTKTRATTIDDYDLTVSSDYKYEIYALEGESLIDSAQTAVVTPYVLPSDLKVTSNLTPSGLEMPNSLCVDGVYYRYSSRGRDDGGGGFGSLWMSVSTDDVTYSEPIEVLSYKDILAHESCQSHTSCRFESQNFRYNRTANKIVFIAHFEADGGYGTAKASFATATPGEKFTFHGAIRPEGDDTRDLNVFVDDDDSAYIMAAVHGNANLAIYRLNSDWSGIDKRIALINQGSFRELPNVLKVDGIYYLFSSGCAGWYPTPGMYNSAVSMEGPWSPLRNVGNMSTFSAQSGGVFRLKEGGTNYIMSPYRWMHYWQDSIIKGTMSRRYPITVSQGYAFYDFFEELLYSYEKDVLVPVQRGRILSQDMPSGTRGAFEAPSAANDGSYTSLWTVATAWPYSWEVDLGRDYSLTQVQISWLIYNGSEPYYQYIIEGSSDGVHYTTLGDRRDGYTDYGFTVDNIRGKARFVRITVTDAKLRNGGENGYPSTLYEVKVLGR